MGTTREVPETILQQLGGAGRLKAMVGARAFTCDDTSLTFKFSAKATNDSNCIVVRLDPSDTYTVEFWHIAKFKCDEIKTTSLVYADQLRAAIEGETGLRLSL